MDFLEVIEQARDVLRTKGRITYRTLQRQFDLDEDALEDLKDELIEAERVAADENGRVLVWTGGETAVQTPDAPAPEPSSSDRPVQSDRAEPTGERRQLTVMFCDLVGSTALSEQLDPEELQTVVRTYQEVSAQVIERYAGYIAQYLGDGLLVYFGYPAAHEDDAARSIRAGLEIITALDQARSQFLQPVQVRIGIHTGPVVVGRMGGGRRHEQLALGETPNIAARVQGEASPDEVIISAATYHLVEGLFACKDRGQPVLKGVAIPVTLYHVLKESEAQSRFQVVARRGLTPLVGREHEQGLLQERWERVKGEEGQVVLLSGEPGIGKSRLVEGLKETVEQEGATYLEFRCSPYAQQSALQPVIEHLHRRLHVQTDEPSESKLKKLQQALSCYHFPQPDTLPLLAALLSLPHPDNLPPLSLSPQKQKEKTYEAIVAWWCEEAEQQAVTYAWEDLHWADPSTLELLTLFLDQVPTTRLLAVLTYRPEFTSPWGAHSYLSHLTLSRLGRSQVETMVEKVTNGKALPPEVVQQITSKTDGVPLFVEELTKMVVESDLVREVNGHYELTGPLPPLAIPSTLQDSLMARLDRLATVRDIAQLGATIGREFRYDLLQAVSPLDEDTLQHGLRQLVDAELVFQSGLPPHAQYLFKHALVQDTAYQSLLKRRRQQLHQQVAQVLELQFAETVETQPELVAHHYTEAGLAEQAIPYWQQAGQRAVERSAHVEAISHLTTGLELLPALPDAPQRAEQELLLQTTLGQAFMATKGYAAPETGAAYTRAHALCQQAGETPQLFPVLLGLYSFYISAGEPQTSLEVGEQLLHLAHRHHNPAFFIGAHYALGETRVVLGEFAQARVHLEQSIALYDSQQHHGLAALAGQENLGVLCRSYRNMALWALGYPDQAREQSEETLALAEGLSHPLSKAYVLFFVAAVSGQCGDGPAAQQQAEVVIELATEQELPVWLTFGTCLRGWVLARYGHIEAGLGQMRQGLAAYRATGNRVYLPRLLAQLAEGYGHAGQVTDGLQVLGEAFVAVAQTGEREYEAEMYRLKGELLLQQSPEQPAEAEACFHTALDVARKQEAKSWELRAATSLARLWQQQGKTATAHQLLSEIYNWFTEGFDTADLKDAKALLSGLSEGL